MDKKSKRRNKEMNVLTQKAIGFKTPKPQNPKTPEIKYCPKLYFMLGINYRLVLLS